MKNSDKVLLGVGLGIIAGGIAGYLLNSDKGRVMTAEAKQKINTATSDLQQVIKEKTDVASAKLSSTTQQAKSWADDVANVVKNKLSSSTDKVETAVETAQDSFKAGMDNARRNIDAKNSTINKIIDNT